MKAVLHITLAFALVFAVGCEMKKPPEGLHVVVKREAATALKQELMPLLVAKGFRSANENGQFSAVYSLSPSVAASPTLYAFFLEGGDEYSFILGKLDRNFAGSDIAIVDEVASVIESHAAMIVHGGVLNAATTPASRERFYAKIKKG